MTGLRWIRTVKYVASCSVLAFLLWDFSAHFNELAVIWPDVGVIPEHGSAVYELTASLILGVVALMMLLAMLAHGVERVLVEEVREDG